MRLLVDTNVIIDALTSREPWTESAEKECMDALASAIRDYEDAVVERTAVKADMDYIITRNVKDYQQGMVKAILPDDFITLMEEDE